MLLPVVLLVAQSYSGPPPAQADLPYLLHAGNLVPTEAAEAKDRVIPGPNSPAKTPLGFPIFILRADKIVPEKLQIVHLVSQNGHREIGPETYALTITRLKDGEYRIEVNDSLPDGEYAISSNGSNQAFCFAVY